MASVERAHVAAAPCPLAVHGQMHRALLLCAQQPLGDGAPAPSEKRAPLMANSGGSGWFACLLSVRNGVAWSQPVQAGGRQEVGRPPARPPCGARTCWRGRQHQELQVVLLLSGRAAVRSATQILCGLVELFRAPGSLLSQSLAHGGEHVRAAGRSRSRSRSPTPRRGGAGHAGHAMQALLMSPKQFGANKMRVLLER